VLRVVDIHDDMPTVDQAVKRVTFNLRQAKTFGAEALKFIHGYGSSGKGGKIRSEVRRYLDRELSNGRIQAVIYGDNFTIFDEATRKAFSVCPELRKDPDLERHNNGVTIVII